MKTIGIGVVGALHGARMHHANFQKLPKVLVEIRCICSRTKESAESYAKNVGVSLATNDFDKLFPRKDIDVTDICTTPASHPEIEIGAAEGRIVMLN